MLRTRQKQRTRQALVDAAGALLVRGIRPDLDAIAEEAGVSRATAYRHFGGRDAVLREAAAALAVPRRAELFGEDAPRDPFERLALLDEAYERACRRRADMLRPLSGRGTEGDARRVALIGEALAPLAPRLGAGRLQRLAQALAMVIGTDGWFALNDAAGLEEGEARDTRRWAIDALVAAALGEAYSAR